jgi:mono/diheme cytochrome c family protein
MKRLLKWIGYTVGGLAAIIVLALAVVYVLSSSRMSKTYPPTQAVADAEALTIPTDSAAINRGHHLVIAVGKCTACHGDNLAGKLISDDRAFAHLWSANLTRGKGGVGATYTDADYVRSIRYGVKADGKPLIFMPSDAFTHFSDADLAAIIAYVKTVPPVDQVTSPPRIGPVMRILSVMIPEFPLVPAENINQGEARPASVPISVTAEYGDYLISTGGCKNCHNPNLSGGAKIQGVAAANLTPAGIGKWSEADFFNALRTGVRPDGRILSAVMPWPETKNLTDDELRAMWMYIRSVKPRPAGG